MFWLRHSGLHPGIWVLDLPSCPPLIGFWLYVSVLEYPPLDCTGLGYLFGWIGLGLMNEVGVVFFFR